MRRITVIVASVFTVLLAFLANGDEAAMDCTKNLVNKCSRRCRKSKEQRFPKTCRLGEKISVRKMKHCESRCKVNTECTSFEFWKQRRKGKFCQLYSCSERTGPEWENLRRLRRFKAFEMNCQNEPACADMIDHSRRILYQEKKNNYGIDPQKNEGHGTRPNIIFILADDIGIGDVEVSQFGEGVERLNHIHTPKLQRMANEGITFTQAYSSNSVCLPSRYSLLVGRHAGRVSVRGNSGIGDDFPLANGDTTIATILQQQDYRTVMIGKWGLGDQKDNSHPVQQGFDEFFGQLTHIDAHSCFPDTLYDNKASANQESDRFGRNYLLPRNRQASENFCRIHDSSFSVQDTNCDFAHDVFSERALQYMEDHVNGFNGKDPSENPFFMFLAWTIPHICSWSNDPKGPQRKVAPFWNSSCEETLVPAPNDDGMERGETSNECKHKSIMEHYIDRDIGRIMDMISATSELSNTLVIFAGDNGPERNEINWNSDEGFQVLHSVDTFNSTNGLRGIKRQLYEGSLRTPMIAWWPDHGAKGAISRSKVVLHDLFATFADLSGVSVPELETYLGSEVVLTSLSLAPSLKGDSEMQLEHGVLYWEYCHQQARHIAEITENPNSFCSWSVVRNGMKLYFDADSQTFQLFDLEKDRFEQTSLYVELAEDAPSSTLLLLQEEFKCIKVERESIPLPSF